MMSNRRIIIGIVVILGLAAVLGLAVWRLQDIQSFFLKPKAAAKSQYVPTGVYKSLKNQQVQGAFSVYAAGVTPVNGHYFSEIGTIDDFFVTGGGTSLGNFTSGFIKTDGTCPFDVVVPGPVTITNGQFNFNYNGYVVSGTFDTSNHAQVTEELKDYPVSQECGGTASGGPFDVPLAIDSCQNSGELTCGGTCVDVRTDINNCGSCGAKCTANEKCAQGACVPGSAVVTGQCVLPSQSHLACGPNGTCIRKLGAGNNLNGCTAVGASCGGSTCSGSTPDACGSRCVNLKTDDDNCGTCSHKCSQDQTCTLGICAKSTTEVNACWGNGGAGTNAGRCYDCNGDGAINILDFSCFAKHWREKIT